MKQNKLIISGRFFWPLLILVNFMLLPVASAADKSFVLAVPFTAQAPTAEWKDIRQQDGCEEAAALMAFAWVKGEGIKKGAEISKKEWRKKIITLSDFEKKKYGEFRDVALKDMVNWIFKDYFKYSKVSVKPVTSAADIIKELEKGNIVLTPMNGQALKNPYFTSPGPERHMILIKGYDYSKQQFITNDPGTRRGENYRYSSKILFNAIRAYSTGDKVPIKKVVKEMIVVEN
ncbi:MAG: C39 family peptidase [Patescibacteria group bacterium]|jgi:hypothetical protein